MSETSFDTSAADTLTSGLSLGQCIKNAAQESQPVDSWYELHPTLEKEWHTLQGEPTSQVSLMEDMSGMPITDMSSCSSKPEKNKDKDDSNPVSRLLDHARTTRPVRPDTVQKYLVQGKTSKANNATSLDFGTPAVTTRHQPSNQYRYAGNVTLRGNQYDLPAGVDDRRQTKMGSTFKDLPEMATPPSWPSNPKESTAGKKEVDVSLLSAQLSNLLEKDDSLAQRVRDLLEDELSARSETSGPTLGKEVPALLQGVQDDSSQATARLSDTSKPRSGRRWTNEYEQDEKIVLSDASLCSASDKTVETRVLNTPHVLLTTLNLFNESDLDSGTFNDKSAYFGEALTSLNSSKGTEYGDLPDTVDIPSDIVKRLNNMRMIGKDHSESTSTSKQAWVEPNKDDEPAFPVKTNMPGSTYEQLPSKFHEDRSGARLSNGAPIAGNAQLYTGSNPTTPQFPIEEEKLQQLQSYIEKKTGMPTISPLIAGGELTPANLLQENISPSTVTNHPRLPQVNRQSFPAISPLEGGCDSTSGNHKDISMESRATGSTGSTLDLNIPKQSTLHVNATSNRSPVDSSNNAMPYKSQQSPPIYPDSLKRVEPEGMSPPVVSTARPLIPNVAEKEQKQTGTTPPVEKDMAPLDQKSNTEDQAEVEDSYLDENLADESLLARIKSALSDSFSHRPINSSCQLPSDALEKSEMSLASSVDSLAAQVRMLLQEELPQIINAHEQHETSNLSEVIENFEHTDLWRFVSQFLPAGGDGNASLGRSFADANQQSFTQNDNTMTDSTLDNSILERIRTELRNSFSNRQQPSPKPEDKYGKKTETQDKERHDISVPKLASLHRSAPLDPPANFIPSQSPIKEHPEYERSLIENSRSYDDHINFDPIPGIPDFSRSVPYQSSNSGNSSRSTTPRPSNVTTEKPPEPKSFSYCRSNAQSVIASQLHRAAQRNFDTSLTPARHIAELPSWKARSAKSNEAHISSYISEEPDSHSNENADKLQSSYEKIKLRKSNLEVGVDETDDSVNKSLENTAQSQLDLSPAESPDHLMEIQQPMNKDVSSTRTSSSLDPQMNIISSVQEKQPLSISKNVSEIIPQVTSGLPQRSSSSSTKSTSIPRRSATTGSSLPKPTRSGGRGIRSDLSSSSPVRGVTPKSPQIYRKKSPIRDRITVHDWLTSPERKISVENRKPLPTFDELMEEEAEQDEEDALEIEEFPLDMIPTSDREKEPSQRDKKKHKVMETDRPTLDRSKPHPLQQHSGGVNTPFQVPEKLEQRKPAPKADWERSSLRPQLDANDSYQEASLCTAGMTLPYNSSSKLGNESDLEMQRRMLNPTLSSEDNADVSRLPSTIREFQSLDDRAQHQTIKQILEWYNSKKNQSKVTEPKRRGAVMKPSKKREQIIDTSLGSNQAVCDSDSTEYCDLPSTRPPTAQTNYDSSQQILSMDETKAEQVMKRLLHKINRQKQVEKAERKRHVYKRNPATSSTPQRSRPPMVVPEASSIASTDTDVGGKYYVKVREKRHPGHKKVTYVEEVSSSEPTVIKVKRRHKKVDVAPTERVVLYDRSVQTASSSEHMHALDASTNFPSPVRRETKKKISKAVQTASTQSSADEPNRPNKDTLVAEEDKENSGNKKKKSKEPQRFSSFYVDLKKNGPKKNEQDKQDKRPTHRSVAWYEPFQYEPVWMHPSQKQDNTGLVRLTLQEAFENQNPQFISKSRERQRRITINSDERRMQEIWAEERQRVFGAKKGSNQRRRSAPPPRRSLQLTRKEIILETRQKYQQLPEVVKKRKDEERKKEYASHRLKAQLYKTKIQNKVLGKYFIN